MPYRNHHPRLPGNGEDLACSEDRAEAGVPLKHRSIWNGDVELNPPPARAEGEAEQAAVAPRREAVSEAQRGLNLSVAISLEGVAGRSESHQVDCGGAAIAAPLQNAEPLQLPIRKVRGRVEVALQIGLDVGEDLAVVVHGGLVDVRHHDVADTFERSQ